MKKLFTLFVIIFFTNSSGSLAQDYAKKGALEIGGNVFFTMTTTVSNGESAENSTITFGAEPYIGYFITNGFEIGLLPTFINSSYDEDSETVLGIFLAPAYVFDLKSKVFPFIEARVGYNSVTFDDGNNSSTSSGISFGGRAGVKVVLGKNALLNLAASYMMITTNPEDWEGDRCGQDIIAIGAGFTIFLGK
ncbi:MAG: opacity family porin [bacterium]